MISQWINASFTRLSDCFIYPSTAAEKSLWYPFHTTTQSHFLKRLIFILYSIHSQVQLNPKTYHWSHKMSLVPLAVCAVPQNRSASLHQPSSSRKKQVMLVTVIPIRFHPQHTIITIFKRFTVITHKIISITISIIIIFISITNIRPITIICITQTHKTTSIIMRIKFLTVVSLLLQVLALVQAEIWVSLVLTSHLI